MRSFLAFDRPMARAAYLLLAAIAFLSQHVFVAVVARSMGSGLDATPIFWLVPFRSFAAIPDAPSVLMAAGLFVALASTAALAMLSLRRVGSTGVWTLAAAFTVVPVLQVFSVAAIALFSPDLPRAAPDRPHAGENQGWFAVTQGVVAGSTIVVFAVAVGALLFGTYGWGVFVASPVLVGFTTGYLVNRGRDVSSGATIRWVGWATFLGGLLLLAFSLEGGLCLVMAWPLAMLLSISGGVIGREIARARGRLRPMLASAAILPAAFASESLLPPGTRFETVQAIEVAAPPSAVWAALTSEAPIASSPPLPLRFGIAYPIRAELHGEGVGAERLGVFSTGVAQERVTAWSENRRLAFEVLKDPPSMRELSPYADVHAPHLNGYFRTTSTSFEIVPTAQGRSRIVERTSHTLRLDPAVYWLPMAKWVVAANNRRVLEHLRLTAEAAVVDHGCCAKAAGWKLANRVRPAA